MATRQTWGCGRSGSGARHEWRTVTVLVLSLGMAHCSGGDDKSDFTNGASGGSGAAGGGATGGSGGTASGSGGASPNSGGSPSTSGGAPSAGGVTGTGGAASTGGGSSGGTPSGTGGATGTGGASAPTSGCGVDPVPSGTGTIDVAGTARTYVFDLPPGYDKNKQYPILFGFHGATTSGSQFKSQYYGNLASAAGNDAVMVYPDALGNPTAWNDASDVPFFDALLTKLESQYCVDKKRIFAAGHSSGGYFSNTLGCQRGDVLRGIGPVSGGGPFVGGSRTCKGQIAVWLAHGKNDTTVLPAQGMASRDYWVKANGCDGTKSSPVTPSPCVEYAGCAAGFPVRWCEYDGDHGYPKFAPEGIWSFFKGL